MLNNIGLPGIILLVLILIGLYFLFRKAPGGRRDGEASRLKYILVWILAGFLANLFTNILSIIWAETFPISLLNPPDQLGIFTAFYAIVVLGGYYIFIGTYSIFKNLDRRKIVLFVWLVSILSILTGVGQIDRLDLDTAYPNYANYNIAALIIGQLVFLGLTLRWIRLNPGFVESPEVSSQPSSLRKEPQIKEKFPSQEAVRSHSESTATMTGRRFSNATSMTGNPYTGTSEDNYTQGQKLNPTNSSEKSDGKNAKDEMSVSDEIQNVNDQDTNKKEILSETLSSTNIDTEETSLDPLHIKDEIYAASKFRDKIELIKLLKAVGFTIAYTDDGLSVQPQSGATEILSDDQALFAYGKQYARK